MVEDDQMDPDFRMYVDSEFRPGEMSEALLLHHFRVRVRIIISLSCWRIITPPPLLDGPSSTVNFFCVFLHFCALHFFCCALRCLLLVALRPLLRGALAFFCVVVVFSCCGGLWCCCASSAAAAGCHHHDNGVSACNNGGGGLLFSGFNSLDFNKLKYRKRL